MRPQTSITEPSRRNIRSTAPRCAPSAIRMPISRVRRATEYALTPYRPTTARPRARPPKTENIAAPARTIQSWKLLSRC